MWRQTVKGPQRFGCYDTLNFEDLNIEPPPQRRWKGANTCIGGGVECK